MMLCLWNGNYEEHDIAEFYATRSGAEKNLERMELEYAKYPGTVVGDFTCLKVEYDWGRRDQRWTCKCNLCGRVIYQYHVSDWRRGKGRSLECKCQKEAKQAEKEAKKESLQALASQKISENQKRVGEIYGEWKIVESIGGTRCVIECTTCGKRKSDKIRTQDVMNLKISPCNHKKPIDYSGDEWIGKSNGHLTVTGRKGKFFIAKCDCGNEITVKPTFMFTYGNKKDCGMPDCPYSTPLERESRERRATGFEFERQVEQDLIAKGYNAVKTQDQADYGVDIIIQEEDGKIAVQCKKQNDPSGVAAVQAVYAGGRYYDCTRFAVISPSGFSTSAIAMARKLGVYLCEKEFNFPSDINAYAKELLPTFHGNEKNKKYYEINGEKKTLGDWCTMYNANMKWVQRQLKDGVSLQLALVTPQKPNKPQFTVNGFTGTLVEICNHFGVIKQTVDYRMKQRGMTIEEAIFTPTNSKTA